MIKPLDKNVLVKEQIAKTTNGIYLPKSDTSFYDVVKVGKNVIEVKEKNAVIVDLQQAKKITYNHEVYYLVKEVDILGVLED